MGYFEKQINKGITAPPKEVVAINRRHVHVTPILLYIEYVEKVQAPYYFMVKSSDGKNLYKCIYKSNKIFLYTMDDIPIFNYSHNLNHRTYPKKIFKGEKEDELLISISKKFSLKAKKFTVEYNGFGSEKFQHLEMNIDKGFRTCGIFLGKEKETTPKICKMMALKGANYSGTRYSLYIAPGVDNLFMIALGIAFAMIRIKAEEYEIQTIINECIKARDYNAAAYVACIS